jgi:hypothetical protein
MFVQRLNQRGGANLFRLSGLKNNEKGSKERYRGEWSNELSERARESK